MQDKIMFKNERSYILIKNGKTFIISNNGTSYSPLAIRITEGFQVELGRDIREIIEAVKFSRLPIIIKKIPIASDSIGSYQIIRMHTGKVDDKIICNISTNNNTIISLSFNRKLINDREYRRYNQLSALHQLSISDTNSTSNHFESRMYRVEQVRNVLKNVIMPGAENVSILEDTDQIIFLIAIDRKSKIKILFIHNKENKSYDLISISLLKN